MKLNVFLWIAILLVAALWTACQLDPVRASEEAPVAQAGGSSPQEGGGLFILTESQLPDTRPGARYEVQLAARGGVMPLQWRLERGALPPGLKLEGNGLLHGSPERAGEFQFTVSVRDSGSGRLAVEKQFVIRVRSGMTLNWKSPAHVNGSRIEGSAEVSNNTSDPIDLTFIVLAVAPNGRATAIGYQHFILAPSMFAKELPFGDSLPHGGYVVHVDAVGEVPAKGLIYRERMQTPGELQVTPGP